MLRVLAGLKQSSRSVMARRMVLEGVQGAAGNWGGQLGVGGGLWRPWCSCSHNSQSRTF